MSRTIQLSRSHRRHALCGKARWTPLKPTGGGDLPCHWYKADAGTWQDAAMTTPAAADGDPVGGWEDLTANADEVTQAVAGSKPALRLAVKNGLPVLRFDGSADYLQGAFTTGGAIAQPFTVFAVAQLDASAVNDDAAHYLTDNDDGVNSLILRTNVTLTPDRWNIRAGANLNGSASDSDWNIWTLLFNGASSQFWHNGISEASGNAGAGVPDGLTVGAVFSGANFWKGDIAEIIIYCANLSDADKNQVGRYLTRRYDILYTDII